MENSHLLFLLLLLPLSCFADSLPGIVYPNVYEVYTDAKFYTTHVEINGKQLKLSNASGNGMLGVMGHKLEGPMGYHNGNILNGYMQPGLNKVRVTYNVSNVVKEGNALDIPELNLCSKMATHTVISNGSLGQNSSYLQSKDVDKLIEKLPIGTTVLLNKKTKCDSKKESENDVVVEYDLKLSSKDKFAQVDLDDCDLNVPFGVIGEILVNGKLVKKMEKLGMTEGPPLKELLKNGENTFTLKVIKFELPKKNQGYIDLSHIQANRLVVSLSCDLDNLKRAHLKDVSGNRAFFNKVTQPLVEFELVEGKVSSKSIHLTL